MGSSEGDSESLKALRERLRAIQDRGGQYGFVGSSINLSAQPPPPHELAPITLEGTGLSLSLSAEAKLLAGAKNLITTPSVQGRSKQTPSSDVERTAEAANPMVHFTRSSDSANEVSQSSDASETSTYQQKDNNKKHEKQKIKEHSAQQLDYQDYVVSLFDPSERIFFLVLDSELERINDFYEKELADASNRCQELAHQLRRLAEHRCLHKEANDGNFAERLGWRHSVSYASKIGIPVWFGAKNAKAGRRRARETLPDRRFSLSVADPVEPGFATRRRTTAGDEGRESPGGVTLPDNSHAATTENEHIQQLERAPATKIDEGAKRRSLALEHMRELAAAKGTTQGHRTGFLQEKEGPAGFSYDPVRYKNARHKLKEAIVEFYRGLELLRSYQVLNRDGIGKILKKFDKVLQTEVSQFYWRARFHSPVLKSTQRIDALLRSTEDAFAGFFEHGDRKNALNRLRNQRYVSNTLRTHHGSTSRTGFFLGLSFCTIVGGLVEALKPEKQARIPSYHALLRVYGALFLPVLFALLFGINLAVFAYARISTTFIFEWNPRTALDFHQYFEFPSLLMLLLSVAFWISFFNPFPETVAPTTWPLVWLVVGLVILLVPLPILYRHSRLWFARSVLRVFGFGLLASGTVEFRDFFLGDELNSIVWSISNLWFIGCEYQREWKEPHCLPNDTYWTAFLSSLPALMRLGQCIRRFADSKFYARVHLLNALKYAMAVFFYFLYINWRKAGSHHSGHLALWVCVAFIYSSFSIAWDILMDWSLLHTNARYPLLRDELVFEFVWPWYYFAIVSNVILRFSWIIYLLPGPVTPDTKTFAVAFLEILRRFQWNFFRVANEHSSNVDQHRALRDTPLPYYIPKTADEGNSDGERRFYKSRLRQWRRSPGSLDVESEAPSVPSAIQPPAPLSTAATASATAVAGRAGLFRRDSLLSRIQTFLVPDKEGWSAKGRRLDDLSAAKGAMGRDYAPRSQEVDADSDDDDEDSEDDHNPQSSANERARQTGGSSERA